MTTTLTNNQQQESGTRDQRFRLSRTASSTAEYSQAVVVPPHCLLTPLRRERKHGARFCGEEKSLGPPHQRLTRSQNLYRFCLVFGELVLVGVTPYREGGGGSGGEPALGKGLPGLFLPPGWSHQGADPPVQQTGSP